MIGRDPARGFRLPVADLPSWLEAVAATIGEVHGSHLTRFLPPAEGARASAVLMLLGEGPDLLIIERAHDMNSHAGQPAFPGGALEDQDANPIEAALREATEETGVDVAGVVPFALLPDLWVPVSNFIVTPVLGWWRNPSSIYVADPREVASVHRVPIEQLADPRRRVRVRHPSGYEGPGFDVSGLRVWGFTAGLISGLLDLAGWSKPWDDTRVVDLDGPLVVDDA